jgi:hypothetical protein
MFFPSQGGGITIFENGRPELFRCRVTIFDVAEHI